MVGAGGGGAIERFDVSKMAKIVECCLRTKPQTIQKMCFLVSRGLCITYSVARQEELL